jgi:hypothetical protein
MPPISLSLEVTQVVVIDPANVFHLLDMGDTQGGEVFYFFRIVGQ